LLEKNSVATRTKAEIWSLGCLFSEAATWLVFGYNGILAYRQKRATANKGNPTFHDGERVLVAVNEQHEQLLQRIGDEDYITKNVIDNIVKLMLEVSENRMKDTEIWPLCYDTLYEVSWGPPRDQFTRLAWKGDLSQIQPLIEAGSINLNSLDDAGWTPLAYAAVYKWKEIVDALLKHGAIPSLQTRNGHTAEELVRQRLKGANSNAREKFNAILALLETPQAFTVVSPTDTSSFPEQENWCLKSSVERELCEKSSVTYRFHEKMETTPGATTIWDLIYNKTPGLDVLESFKAADWYWLHLPANNVCPIARIQRSKANISRNYG